MVATLKSETDQALLARFAEGEDEEAFTVLVRRHTRLVFATCLRVLGQREDAEDATQRVFHILARKAGRLACGRERPRIPGWLRRVSYCVARDARSARTARIRYERRAGEGRAARVPMPPEAREERILLLRALHEELRALPASYRDVMVLFHVQALKCAEIAGQIPGPSRRVSDRAPDPCRETHRRRGASTGATASRPRCGK